MTADPWTAAVAALADDIELASDFLRCRANGLPPLVMAKVLIGMEEHRAGLQRLGDMADAAQGIETAKIGGRPTW